MVVSAPPVRILTIPGYTNSGPEHWQTLWERVRPGITRVRQRDWNRPIRDEWVATLNQAVRASREPAVLVAHSLGCATVAHWVASQNDPHPAVAALLVAPADVDQPGWPEEVVGFRPMPLVPLALRTTVVASSDDPWVSAARSRLFAAAWGSRLIEAGAVGHLSSELGAWPDGWRVLEELLNDAGLDRDGFDEATGGDPSD